MALGFVHPTLLRSMKSTFAGLLSFVTLAHAAASSSSLLSSKPDSSSQGKHGAVVGEESSCADVGVSIMRDKGGNAADAVCG